MKLPLLLTASLGLAMVFLTMILNVIADIPRPQVSKAIITLGGWIFTIGFCGSVLVWVI